MNLLNKEVYDAFIESGASEEKASKAAESIAEQVNINNEIKRELAIIRILQGVLIAGVFLPILKDFIN